MKRFLTLLITAILLVASLTSCVCSNIGVSLNKDGTGSVTTSVGIEKNAYNQIKALGGSDPFEGKTLVEQTVDGKAYMMVSETKECSSYDEIKETLLALTYNSDKLNEFVPEDEEAEPESGYTLYQPVKEEKSDAIFSSVDIDKASGILYSVYTFHAVLNPLPKPDIDPETAAEMNINLDDYYKVVVSVTMPEKITQSTDGTVDGKEVTFKISNKDEAAEIGAISEVNHYFVVIAAIVLLLVILAVVVIIVKRKK